MTATYEKQPILTSLGPHLGLFAGATVGWVVMWLACQPVWGMEAILGRLVSIVSSLVLWSLFSVGLQQKEIYGGGLLSVKDGAKDRLRSVLILFLLLWILSLLFYATRRFPLSASVTLVLTVLFVSELCFRDPFWVFKLKGKSVP